MSSFLITPLGFLLTEIQKTPLQQARILLIDDSELNQEIIRKILYNAGYRHLDVAASGQEGLKRIYQATPDLILLDLAMPEPDGFECCRILRANPLFEMLPIIVQTAINDPSERAKAFAMGASDFVHKPIDEAELLARIQLQLERQRMLKVLYDTQQRMHQELSAASIMQLSIMPTASEMAFYSEQYGFSVSSALTPSSELGGDFWGLIPINDHHIAIYMVDFSGHGVMAAMNTLRLHTLMSDSRQQGFLLNPGAYLSALNLRLNDILPAGQFATMFFGVINRQTNQLSYAAASSPTPYLMDVSTGRCVALDGSGTPLGVSKGATYVTHTHPLPPNTLLFLYSDALTETTDERGDVLDEKTLLSILQNGVTASHDPAHISKSVTETMRLYFQRHFEPQMSDDLSIIAGFVTEKHLESCRDSH